MEQINLNLIPSGIMPRCHVSQYDAGRVIKFNLYDGNTPYAIASGDTVTLNVRKPDNTIVTAAATATQGQTFVTIETTEQMCAVFGDNLCELNIANGGDSIGSLNFIMEVEEDVLSNGDPSQSEIHDLSEQVDALLTPYKYKDYTGTLTAGSTTLDIHSAANDPIFTINSTFDFYTSVYGVNPTNVQVFEAYVDPKLYTTARFTFEAQAEDLGVKVRVYQ